MSFVRPTLVALALIIAASVACAENTEKEKIHAALARIESSPRKFIRNGDEYDGKAAAAHLRRKLDAAGDKIKTFDDFVDQIATKSSVSGEPYRVKLEDGQVVDLAKWLREAPGTQPSR